MSTFLYKLCFLVIYDFEENVPYVSPRFVLSKKGALINLGLSYMNFLQGDVKGKKYVQAAYKQ